MNQSRHVSLAAFMCICTLTLVLGYFIGREHLKYEVRAAFSSAAGEVQKTFASTFNPRPFTFNPRSVDISENANSNTEKTKDIDKPTVSEPEPVVIEPPKPKVVSPPPPPPPPKEKSPIHVTLLKKGFKDSDIQAGEFQDYLTNTLLFKNATDKDIRAFDGIVIYADLLDNEILKSKMIVNDTIKSGAILEWEGGMDYNQFIDSHRRFRNTEQSSIKVTFMARKVLFADGTSKEYE